MEQQTENRYGRYRMCERCGIVEFPSGVRLREYGFIGKTVAKLLFGEPKREILSRECYNGSNQEERDISQLPDRCDKEFWSNLVSNARIVRKNLKTQIEEN